MTISEADCNVHPYAKKFPRLGAKGLADLAQSIEQNGQMDPIVIAADETILDGRNRLAACDIAGIEPQFETLEAFCGRTATQFAGPVEFIAARNLRRRHLPSSVAATLALEAVEEMVASNGDGVDPDPVSDIDQSQPAGKGKGRPQTKRGKATSKVSKDTGVSERDIRRATQLKNERPDLHKKVQAGKMKLQEATTQMEKDGKSEAEKANMAEALKLISDEKQQFRDAVARGELLRSAREVREYASFSRDEKTHLRNLLSKSWKLPKAIKYMIMEVGAKTTVEDLQGIAACQGGWVEVSIGDWRITVEKEPT